jgi:hypothetical protein
MDGSPGASDLIDVSGKLGCQHLSGVTSDAGAPKWVIRAA